MMGCCVDLEGCKVNNRLHKLTGMSNLQPRYWNQFVLFPAPIDGCDVAVTHD